MPRKIKTKTKINRRGRRLRGCGKVAAEMTTTDDIASIALTQRIRVNICSLYLYDWVIRLADLSSRQGIEFEGQWQKTQTPNG